MPSSFHHHISKMVDWIVKVQPRSVLDIGVGHGKWGFLAREYTDIFNNRYDRSTWQTRIEGVEAFATYKTPVYDYAYDKIHYGDISTNLKDLANFDLVIIGDVIEHLTKEEGQALIAALREKSAYILLSSPTHFFQQEILGNPWETHKSLWSWKDFQGYDFDYDEIDHSLFVAIVRGQLPATIDVKLNGRASEFVYSIDWLKKRPKLAQLVKTYARRRMNGIRT